MHKDIPVPLDLQKLLDLPPCDVFKLPNPGPLNIHLPMGGRISAIADVSKGLPNDCTLSFNLLLQLAPFLASFGCLFKLLNLVKPMAELVGSLTGGPPPGPSTASDMAKALKEIVDCFNIVANIPLFVKDILCVIIKLLKCILDVMRSIVDLMGGLAIQLNLATAEGDAKRLKAIQCAQENLETAGHQMTQAVEPITTILGLLEPFLKLAGVPNIALPAFAPKADIESMRAAVDALQDVLNILEAVADPLPIPGPCV